MKSTRLAGNKRGAHPSLSLERLATLWREHQGRAPTCIGLSATQKPIEELARFLTGKSSCGTGKSEAKGTAALFNGAGP